MTKTHQDAGIIVAICIILAALLVGVYLINNSNGRDSSGFQNTGADVNTTTSAPLHRKSLGRDDSQPDDSVVSHAGRSSTPAVAVEWVRIGVEGNVIEGPRDAMSKLLRRLGLYIQPSQTLFEAISKIESNHDDSAVGQAGERGRYQITEQYWLDGCEEIAERLDVPLENVEEAFYYSFDVYNPRICQIIMTMYWQRYGALTDEQKARMHNSGPDMEGTDQYWERVKNLMEANE